MKVSFEGIDEKVVTFYNNSTSPAAAGEVVKISGNGEVSACSAGDRICGVCLAADEDHAAVQMGGYMKLDYSGTAPAAGYATLAADGMGGVKGVSTGGATYLVIDVDSSDAMVGIML